MGIPVMILGNSGTGKSASLRNLDEACYGLINVAKKPLPFRNTKKAFDSDDYAQITALLKRASSDIIIIDDAQYLMANEFMRRAKETGYQKYTDIGKNFWDLVQTVVALPPQKIVYFLGHTEVDQFGNTKFKTIGKLLDDKITVEGMFTIVLRTSVQDGKFFFSTVNDGTDTVKTPLGMFTDRYIDNDLVVVDKTIREYYGLAPVGASKKTKEALHANSLV